MAFNKEYWASYFARQVYDEHLGDFIRGRKNISPDSVTPYKNSGWNLVRFLDDVSSGYFGAAFVKSDGSWAIITNRGTDDRKDFIADMELWYKSKESYQFSLQINKGIELFKVVKASLVSSVKILITGHSLGGSIAEVVGLTARSEVIVFDSPGADYFLENKIGLQKIVEIKRTTGYAVTAYQSDPNCINGLNTRFFDKIYRIQNLFSEKDFSSNLLFYLYKTLVDLHRVDNLAWSIGPNGPFMIEDVTEHWQYYVQDYGRAYSYNCNLNPESCSSLLADHPNFLFTKEGYLYRQHTNDNYPVGVTILLSANFIPGISGGEESATLESIRNYHHNIRAASGTNYNDLLQSQGKYDNIFRSFAGKDSIVDDGGFDKYIINLNPNIVGKNHLYQLEIYDQDHIGVVIFEDFSHQCILRIGESYRLNNKKGNGSVYLSVLDSKCQLNTEIVTGVVAMVGARDKDGATEIFLYGNGEFRGNVFLDYNLLGVMDNAQPQFGIKLFDDNYTGGVVFCSKDQVATLVNIGSASLKYVGYAGNPHNCHIVNQAKGVLVVKKHSISSGSIFVHGSVKEIDLSEIARSLEDFDIIDFQIICKQLVTIIFPEIETVMFVQTAVENYEIHLGAQKTSGFMGYFDYI